MKFINEAIQIWTDELGLEHIKTAKSIYLKGNLYLRMKNTAESNYLTIYRDLAMAEQLIT